MNIIHHFIIIILYKDYTDKEGFTDSHLELIFQREGHEGIVDTINYIEELVLKNPEIPMVSNKKIYDMDEDVLYDICKRTINTYLLLFK